MSEIYAEICTITGKYKNTILWDGITPYSRPNTLIVLKSSLPKEVGFGCKKQNDKWFKSEYNHETGEETWTEIN